MANLRIVGANPVNFRLGVAALVVLARFSRQPARHFLILSGVGLVLSFGLPISAGLADGSAGTPTAGVATVVTLCLLHVASYAVGVPMLVRLVLTQRD